MKRSSEEGATTRLDSKRISFYDDINENVCGGSFRLIYNEGIWKPEFLSEDYCSWLGATPDLLGAFLNGEDVAGEWKEESAIFLSALSKVSQKPGNISFNTVLCRRDGKRLLIRNLLHSEWSEKGEMVIWGEAFDISDLIEKEIFYRNQVLDADALLHATRSVFPEILFVNLTKNTYRMLQYDKVTTRNTPREGVMDDMINIRLPYVHEEDQKTFLAAFSREELSETFCRGEDTLKLMYRRLGNDGNWYWFESIVMRQDNPFDDDVLCVAVSHNITDKFIQAQENQRLRENEQILQMVAQHSDRTVCYYDVKEGMARSWGVEHCEACGLPGLCEKNFVEMLESNNVLPESRGGITQLFQDIHSGVPNGEFKLHIKTEEGERRWFGLKYSTIFDKDQKPMTALISYKDITDNYVQEVAHLRYMQSLEQEDGSGLIVMEWDLNSDVVENFSGLIAGIEPPVEGEPITQFVERALEQNFFEENRQSAKNFLSVQYLIDQYRRENRYLEAVWRIRRHNDVGWIHLEIELMADPYMDHVRAFLRVKDITKEKEEQLSVQLRAERDGMTGLLNRTTCEEQITNLLAHEKDKGGILFLLDLDDLKKINDTYGHEQGDRAIRGIAGVLKSHFRDRDIVGRIGGDEFLAFLPGAAENLNAISFAAASLMRKLVRISVGKNDETRIHCSIGCAVQIPGVDTFESLYEKADIALYHVKRNGKNNFAFYSHQMEDAEYQFKQEGTIPFDGMKRIEAGELQYLLSAISIFYPLVMSVNLTRNDFYLMVATDSIFSQLPTFGTVDYFIDAAAEMVHVEDRDVLVSSLSRKNLLDAYERGEKSVRYYFRDKRGEERASWAEATVIFYVDDDGDVCDFTLIRWTKAHLPS